jgi:hypothetical protein
MAIISSIVWPWLLHAQPESPGPVPHAHKGADPATIPHLYMPWGDA